jgi:mono/diheme cytochrome c family protein
MSVETNKTSTGAMEAAEPKEGWSPMPVLLIGLLALLVFLGFMNLENHGGGFNKMVYVPYHSSNDVWEAWPVDPHQEHLNRGKKLFNANCAACHQTEGQGSPAQNAPPLAGSDWVNAASPNRVIRIVLNGLTGPLTVSGKQFGLATMVPWRDNLKDDEIADILTYVRSNKSWGNSASDVTPEQVKAIRDKTANKVGPWIGDDLSKIPDKD